MELNIKDAVSVFPAADSFEQYVMTLITSTCKKKLWMSIAGGTFVRSRLILFLENLFYVGRIHNLKECQDGLRGPFNKSSLNMQIRNPYSPKYGSTNGAIFGKRASPVFVMIDCLQSMKIESGKASIMGSISDYLFALSNAWDMRSFLKSVSSVIKSLRLGSNSTANKNDGSSRPGMEIYVVCPSPEPVAVLQTVIESSVALGSTIVSSVKEKRFLLYTQVGRAVSSSAAVDEHHYQNFQHYHDSAILNWSCRF